MSLENIVILSSIFNDTEENMNNYFFLAAKSSGISLYQIFNKILAGYYDVVLSWVTKMFATEGTFIHNYESNGQRKWKCATFHSVTQPTSAILATTADIFTLARHIFRCRIYLMRPESLPSDLWFSQNNNFGSPDSLIKDLAEVSTNLLFHK